MINLHQLRLFAAVVEEASFTAAASRLYLTQPAVSAQIRYLRKVLGLPIVAREGRRVVTTEAGMALYRYACQVLAMTESLWREVQEISSGVMDHIVVGGNHTYGQYVVPELLARFRSRYPTTHFSVVDGTTTEIVNQVRSGRVDIGIVVSVRVPPDLVVARLGADEPIIIDSTEHAVSHSRTLTLEQVAAMPFVGTRRPEALRDGLDRLLLEHGFGQYKVVMEITTLEGVKAAVRAGVGVALVLRAVVRAELDREEFHVIEVEGFRGARNVDLICSPRRRVMHMPRVFRDLLEFLQQQMPHMLNPARPGDT